MKSNKHSTDEFLNLLMNNQRKIRSYIRTLVFDFNDSEDLFQETITTMWSKFDQFEPGTDFASWGVMIAYFKILNYRKKHGKEKLSFNDEVLEHVSSVSSDACIQADERVSVLRNCIGKLNQDDRRLLEIRYELNCAPKNIAAQLEKSVQYVYKHLSRIHLMLNRCVKRQMHMDQTQ